MISLWQNYGLELGPLACFWCGQGGFDIFMIKWELWWWYWQVPEELNNASRILLHFQAVDWQATVYLDKQELGTHQYSHTYLTKPC